MYHHAGRPFRFGNLIERPSTNFKSPDERLDLLTNAGIDQRTRIPCETSPDCDPGILKHRVHQDEPFLFSILAHVAKPVGVDRIGDAVDARRLTFDLDSSPRSAGIAP
jgi:hypothetical protein